MDCEGADSELTSPANHWYKQVIGGLTGRVGEENNEEEAAAEVVSGRSLWVLIALRMSKWHNVIQERRAMTTGSFR